MGCCLSMLMDRSAGGVDDDGGLVRPNERTRLLDARFYQSQDAASVTGGASTNNANYISDDSERLDSIIQFTAENLIDIAGSQVVEKIQPEDAKLRSMEYQRLLNSTSMKPTNANASEHVINNNLLRQSTLSTTSATTTNAASGENIENDFLLLNEVSNQLLHAFLIQSQQQSFHQSDLVYITVIMKKVKVKTVPSKYMSTSSKLSSIKIIPTSDSSNSVAASAVSSTIAIDTTTATTTASQMDVEGDSYRLLQVSCLNQLMQFEFNAEKELNNSLLANISNNLVNELHAVNQSLVQSELNNLESVLEEFCLNVDQIMSTAGNLGDCDQEELMLNIAQALECLDCLLECEGFTVDNYDEFYNALKESSDSIAAIINCIGVCLISSDV